MEVAITKISSKGQIVIPAEIRKGIDMGEEFVIIKSENRFILKRVKDIDKNFKEDLEFAKRTEDAWEKYESGEFEEKEDKLIFLDFYHKDKQ